VSIGTGHGAAQREPRPEEPRRPGTGKKWKLVLVSLAGVYVLLAGYDLITSSGTIGINTVASAAKSAPTSGAGTSSSSAGSAKPAQGPPGSTALGPAPQPLAIDSIAAFGPQGASDGDNPGIAFRVLDVRTDQPWYSQWYATPDFGNLQSGTGLLLDMGKTVTVRDVQLGLGSAPGTDVQVRVGNGPFLDLPTVASARDVGGDVRLTATAPAEGQYVLVWFTRLPPDGHGHYQVSVYSVSVNG
jgi:hypothetical protein